MSPGQKCNVSVVSWGLHVETLSDTVEPSQKKIKTTKRVLVSSPRFQRPSIEEYTWNYNKDSYIDSYMI